MNSMSSIHFTLLVIVSSKLIFLLHRLLLALALANAENTLLAFHLLDI